MKLLDKTKINSLIPSWNYKVKPDCYNYIQRKVKFPTFNEACTFLNKLFEENKKLDHHCKYISDYNKIKIKIYTHSSKDVTEKDIQLAQIIDDILKCHNHQIIEKNQK
ncbi:pterin-4a-carbinolamine dehydratase [Plasmodium reichenowi]|uniref:4a-hydroxytetrahydrobiopterin dehydratase n=1 Tax=Plasmodium reichenowi TaxID=5854 RepID=A0A2P9DHT6_PLARE|nr:pterin-4a-carbinolamine dehydratase [Plasmodium reichenowi]